MEEDLFAPLGMWNSYSPVETQRLGTWSSSRIVWGRTAIGSPKRDAIAAGSVNVFQAGAVGRWGWHVVLPAVCCATIGIGLHIVLPRSFHLTLSGFLSFAPDAAALAVSSGVFAIVWGLARTVAVSMALRSLSE